MEPAAVNVPEMVEFSDRRPAGGKLVPHSVATGDDPMVTFFVKGPGQAASGSKQA